MIELVRRPVFLLIALSTLVVIAMSAISLIGAISCINKPFAGFIIYDPPYVASMGSREWPGKQAGLKFLDRIVAVDNQPVRKGRDVSDLIREKAVGTSVRYTVEAKGEIREVNLPVTLFGIRDFLLVFFTPFLPGLILCTLGIVVVSLKPNMTSSWVFLNLCISMGGYMMTGFEIMTSYVLVHLHYLITCLYPFAILHLALIFPDKKRILTRWPALEYLIYIPCLILVVAWQIYLFTFPKLLGSQSSMSTILSYKFLGSTTRLFLLFSIVLFIILVTRSLFKAPSISARQRARMILFGVGIGFLPPAIILLSSHLLKFSPGWNYFAFFILCFPASIAYSIVRHNLFDADIIIRRTVGYAIVTAVVIGAYLGVSLVINVIAGQYELDKSRTFPILFTLGVILVFNPLRDRIQALVDRVFFRKEYDYGAIVEKVSGAMTSLLELPEILKSLVQTFMEDMFIDTGSVILLSPAGVQYEVSLAEGEQKRDVGRVVFNRDDPLMEIIEGEKKELTKYDVIEDPKYKEVSESCAANFEALNASLMIPLIFQDKIIGSLNLGEKKSGKTYNREDIDLLRTLANQAAVAIENARLFQENLEKQRMEEELNIARDLQMSMLPSECPTVEGLDIAAYSLSAMEVGGDFYDFIDMGDKKLGFVIGDVTGKSVSGALVMSASRSVFRMLSEQDLNVSESMILANRRLKKDISSGMFVALLYAVIDAGNQSLTLCSAGQTQPIQVSTKEKEAHLVDTEGDTFPLGILEEADYEETQRQLAPGDKVIFYTDGIVEAMNAEEEMFGFERLLEVVQEARSMSADSLLKEILERVNEFVGDARQHDDLTVIVVGVMP